MVSRSRLLQEQHSTDQLASARRMTLLLVSDLDSDQLRYQPDPEFSPIGWHLGHVAWQEEVWLLRHLAGCEPLRPEYDAIFNSFECQKSLRSSALPGRTELLEYMSEVRERSYACLEHLELEPGDGPMQGLNLLHFIANHERQHAEIMTTVRLLARWPLAASSSDTTPSQPVRSSTHVRSGFAAIDGGPFVMGAVLDPNAWDNELQPHVVDVAPFQIARQPVNCGEWLEFMHQLGYRTPSLWSDVGWEWRQRTGVEHPLHWERRGNDWLEHTLAGTCPIDSRRPVAHVSFYEAEAFARFAGARLPTEREWEYAAAHDPVGTKRRWPWGDVPHPGADLDLRHLRPSRSVEHVQTLSAFGVAHMAGGVWEWSADIFAPYPEFQPQAYEGYSQPWFDGAHRVARGGSFASAMEIGRCTFRSWYTPDLRQPCLGLRLARDAS